MSERNPAATLATSSARESAAAPEKPNLCPNCAEREPTRLVEGVKKGKLGIPVAVWLCEACAAAIPEPKKKSRPVKGRLSTGKHGTVIMKLVYRFGGFTMRQLGPMLLLEQPSRFAKSRKAAEEKAAEARLPEAARKEAVEEAVARSARKAAY